MAENKLDESNVIDIKNSSNLEEGSRASPLLQEFDGVEDIPLDDRLESD